MAVVALKIRVMPDSVEANLQEIQAKIKEKASKMGAMNISFVEESVAFGLKAIVVTLAYPEEKDTSALETELGEIENVSSAQIIDYRRAFG